MKKSFVLLFFLAFLICLIGIIAFFFKKSSNWKIYTDPNLGYSFQYPASWTEDKTGNIGVYNYNKNNGVMGDFYVDPTNYYQIKEPIKDWIDKEEKDYQAHCGNGQGCGGGSPMIFVRETVIGGQKATKTTSSVSAGPTAGTQIHYIIPYQGKIFIMTLGKVDPSGYNSSSNFDEDGSQLATIFQTMLSSFKFPK